MQIQQQGVHFSVEPHFYERHARALMLEDNWRGAISFLRRTLTDIPLDVVEEVLQGITSLKAVADGVKTSPQDPNDAEFRRFKETYDWQHAGILHSGSEFYQPYGFVQRFGAEDMRHAHEEMALLADRDYSPNEYRTLRARFHSHHRESDLIQFSAQYGAVFFKRVQGPAFWHETFEDWEQALEHFLSLRRLDNIDRAEPRRRNPSNNFVDPETDPAHWKFYVEALRVGQLRTSRWDEQFLEPEVLEVLAQLQAHQDQVLEAKYEEAAREAGNAGQKGKAEVASPTSEELAERLETAVLRAEIVERANKEGGFIELVVREYYTEETRSVQVPAIPLMRWAARNIRGFRWEDLPSWRPVCPQGLKTMGDNPLHTDWWVGAGFAPRGAYDMEHPLNKAAWRFAMALSESHGCDFVKLAGKGRVLGRVVFPKPNEAVLAGSIAVVPYAGVDYEMAMLSACKAGGGAVISAVGGKLAHLATVARETESRIVVVNNAMEVFQEGELVTLDLEAMTLTRHETILTPRGGPDED